MITAANKAEVFFISQMCQTSDLCQVFCRVITGLVIDFPAGMVEIKTTSPFKALLGAIAIAAFWNGIVSVFVFQLFAEFHWFLALFLIPFVLIGLFIIGYAVMRFLISSVLRANGLSGGSA